MKKIKFLVEVQDKYTKELYKQNDVREFEDKRADEILSARRYNGKPYAEIVKKIANKNIKEETEI